MYKFTNHETIRVLMRLSLLPMLLTVVLTHGALAANAQELLDQRVSVRLDNNSVRQALLTLEKTAHVKFVYSRQVIEIDRKVSLSAVDEKLVTILERLLKPLQLRYVVTGSQIAIVPGPAAEVVGGTQPAQESASPNSVDRAISGTVKSESGEALPGVSVVIKNTTRGTATDADGNFKISFPEEGTTLVFSFVGYLNQEVVIGNRTTVDVQLLPDQKNLNEVVVVGYGTQQKEDITGAIAMASAKELKDPPVAQVAQMLQGKLVGVRIDQVSGRPGEGMNIKIRGAVSITAGANPLYVVNGMPITGDINTINPAEIESISVLKDAAASSLYGSRAGNGVVLIQTKTAKIGKTQIDFSAYYGFEKIPDARKLKMMNAQEYAQFQKEIATANGRAVNPVFQNPEQYAGKGTNWYDVVTRTGAVQSYNLSLSSGVKNFLTTVTGGYFKQDGVVISTGFQRVSLRVNTVFTPSDKVKIGFNMAPNYAYNTNLATDGNPYGSENIVSGALATSPLASPYNADGSLALTASDPATFGNPNWLRVADEKVYKNKNQGLLANAYVEYEFLKGLKAKSTANIQLGNANIFQFNPSTIGVLFTPPPRIPSGSDNTTRLYNWVNENSLAYQTEFNGHSIDALVDFTAQRFRSENAIITATNYSDDKISGR